MKKTKQQFTAKLVSSGPGGVYIEIPFDVEKEYGARGRVPVKATFDGEPYRGSIFPYGGVHLLLVLKAIRQKLDKDVGDSVRVTLELDTQTREVKLPDDFRKALGKNKKAKTVFEDFSYNHRREYVMWIESAKQAETRARRIAKAVEMIATGHKEAWAIRMGKDEPKPAARKTKK
ncbi:YdeI/OmpD-associated family protein [bacterium]|nr:YdeI/OmpD-associated family protein [bacterium]MBU1983460.1 YdeI/OmpD-associated family protein [bacterium]